MLASPERDNPAVPPSYQALKGRLGGPSALVRKLKAAELGRVPLGALVGLLPLAVAPGEGGGGPQAAGSLALEGRALAGPAAAPAGAMPLGALAGLPAPMVVLDGPHLELASPPRLPRRAPAGMGDPGGAVRYEAPRPPTIVAPGLAPAEVRPVRGTGGLGGVPAAPPPDMDTAPAPLALRRRPRPSCEVAVWGLSGFADSS